MTRRTGAPLASANGKNEGELYLLARVTNVSRETTPTHAAGAAAAAGDLPRNIGRPGMAPTFHVKQSGSTVVGADHLGRAFGDHQHRTAGVS